MFLIVSFIFIKLIQYDCVSRIITAKQRRRKAERQEAAQQETKYLKDKIDTLTTNLNSESEFNQSQISNDSNTVVSTTSPIQGLPSMFREWRHSKTTW